MELVLTKRYTAKTMLVTKTVGKGITFALTSASLRLLTGTITLVTPPANQRASTFMTTETMLMVGSGDPPWATDKAHWKDSFLQSTRDTVARPWSTTSLQHVRTNLHLLPHTITFQMVPH